MMLVTGMTLVTGLATLFGVSCVPFTISSLSLAALVAAVTLAWLKYGRDVLPLHSIFSVVAYVLGKLPLYRQIFSSRERVELGADRPGQGVSCHNNVLQLFWDLGRRRSQ